MGLHNTTEKPDSAVMSINVQTEKGKKTHKLKDYATFEFKKDASDLPDLEKFTLRPQSVEILQSYHSIKILTNQSLHIEIIPTNHCVNFSVYLKKEDKPTVKDHDMNWTLPLPCSNNASSNFCLFYETRAQELNSLPNMTDQEKLIQLHKDMKNLSWPCSDPYTIFLSNLNLTIGKYWIGKYYKYE